MGERRVLDRARALGPELRDRSQEIEELRRLPDDLVEGLIADELLRFWVPRAVGGPELGLLDGLEVFRELARHDTGVAWCSMIANTTALCAGLLPAEHAGAIFGDPGAVAGGLAAPAGRARVVDGGLRVTGRWAWGSGSSHATALAGGVLLVDDDGRPAPRDDGLLVAFAFFDLADVEVHDTWHVLGVRGSGSHDYEVRDAFVPEGRWVELTRPVPSVDGPLYRFPVFTMLAASIAAVAVGVAERAIEELARLAAGKVPQGSSRTLAERSVVQADLARAEATAGSAWAFLTRSCEDAWQVARMGEVPSVEQRRTIRLAATDATQRSADAVSRLHRLAGGEAVYQRCPLERLLRDANVVSQHAMTAERTYELAGRLRLGLDSDTSTL